MQINWKLTGIIAAIALGIGVFVGSSLDCHSAPVMMPGKVTVSDPIVPHDTLWQYDHTDYHDTLTNQFYDTLIRSRTIRDTVRLRAVDTVFTPRFTVHNPAVDSILAAFTPRSQINTFEVWLDAKHDLFHGGFGGGASLELNLDKLGISNAVPFLRVGYLHGSEVSVGVKGKVWGAF